MSNLGNGISLKKAILLVSVALIFMLNIVVSNQVDDNSRDLSGVVNSAFAEEENLGDLPPHPLSITPEEEESDDDGIIDIIIGLLK